MNGYQLTKAFYAELAVSEEMQMDARPHHLSLYTWICELRNKYKREVLDLPVIYTMQMSLIGSQHTLAKAIAELEKWGIIEVLMQTKGQGTKVKIAIAFMQKHCNSDANDVQMDSNYDANGVQRKKTLKTNKTDKTDKTEINDAKASEFDLFWDMYAKKVDNRKCRKKWDSFSVKVKSEIMSALPAYIARTPDPQFRKNPLTFLNGENWKDEANVKPLNPEYAKYGAGYIPPQDRKLVM